MENDNYDLLSDWAEQQLWEDEVQLEVEDEDILENDKKFIFRYGKWISSFLQLQHSYWNK